MKKVKMPVVAGLVVVAVLQLCGCSPGYQAKNAELKDLTLVNPDILKKGTDGQAVYRYVLPNAAIDLYTKVMIDPVLVRKDGELNEKELENYQTLANNAYLYLKQELSKNYQIVNAPEARTLRIQMAIIDADNTKPVRNTLSTFIPIGIAINYGKYAVTGKQAAVGEITAEMKITDARDGTLLGAAVDRRVGGKELAHLWDSWYNADDALKYWAQRLSFSLCDMRGGKNCVKPDR